MRAAPNGYQTIMAGNRRPTGREPVEAKPAYRLRLAFAVFGLVLGVVGVLVFGTRLWSDSSTAVVGGLIVSVLVAVVAALNVVIVNRRRRSAQNVKSTAWTEDGEP